MDLKNWMTNLDEEVKTVPVIFLSIPGSHDSMTYTINESSKVAPDAQLFVKILTKIFGNIVKRIVLKWSITQNSTVEEQLNYGIRYFDLRLATNDTDSNFYITHALFGEQIDNILIEINKFLTENEQEIVILDFQHFYGFTQDDHLRFMNLVEVIFCEKLCPLPWDINTVTLSWMRDKSYQVIVIYRNISAESRTSFWPSLRYPTPWPETTSVEQLIPFLQSCLSKRYQNKGLVTQCVLTPDNLFVAKHILSSLKNTCAIECRRATLPWLNLQHPGVQGVNVVISDFIDFNDEVEELGT
ncbi:PI-PLC X domain-containing protein 2 isoform X4 [Nilaparvata lugens]|uniref:PI-PLC X domain-containing protein 2 isoform X4 n=1 Tax=Nilaparvata lugens TaxID=108931 RepID=UPI00193DD24D|nr:PI-PLC X domain-containing protein 2 isoform X4 [Nilaparvata lugens]